MHSRALESLRDGSRDVVSRAIVHTITALIGVALLTRTDAPAAAPPCGDGESCVVMEVGSASGETGGEVSIGVRLRTQGYVVASNTSELVLDRGLSLAPAGGTKGDCTVGSGIERVPLSDFRLWPRGCVPGVDCTGVRTVILTPDPIADGTLLYTCRVRIGSDASPGDHAARLTRAAVSDPSGNDDIPVSVAGGVITVVAPELAASDRGSSSGGTTSSGGGCQLAPRTAGGAAAFLLVPLLWVGVRRRRRWSVVDSRQ